MELFFSRDIDGSVCRLDADESAHCVKVLRHREGDDIHVIDGEGTLYTCRILSASPKEVEAQVTGVERDWGSHPYRLRMAVCPTKNTDRYEWFAEKATELGVDVITPVIGDHSERKVFKTDRLKRILLSASKQSLKGAVPQVDEALPLRDLIRSYASSDDVLKLICCCYEGEEKRTSIEEVLLEYPDPKIVILIGPEGDFSREEVALALECGFRPVHLGPSRLRTETAALAAVAAVYFHYCGDKGM
ncbi:MAG: 16S rRNA (uracil(1498)-N(3))-methyltransferase [Bacteroidales bacterium]|nr:16S rRNA (uracil(1498)-N(3))-methyltransferase [Bacteroidales bacterium]